MVRILNIMLLLVKFFPFIPNNHRLRVRDIRVFYDVVKNVSGQEKSLSYER
jgi:hypothetical protein